MFFKYPISEIESFYEKKDGFAKLEMNIKEVLPKSTQQGPVFGYVFNSTFVSLYQGIKQKLVDIIMQID